MNGTSMASPNAAGSTACLLSALKSLKIPISPFRIRMALENSAKMPEACDDLFSYGYGLMQINSALNLLKQAESISAIITRIRIAVTCVNQNKTSKRGIYIREKYQSLQFSDFDITIKPKFKITAGN